MQPIVTCSISL